MASFNLVGGSLTGLSIFLALVSVAVIGFLIFGIFKKTERYFFSAALILMLLVLALISFNSSKILGFSLPREAALTYKQSWDVSRSALAAHPALGSGPGTFAYDYSLYRPASANSGAFWQIRFDKSGSQVLELLATNGLLAVLAYLLIVSLAVYLSAALISKRSLASNVEAKLPVAIFAVFVLSFVAQIFFPTTTVLNFTFWFFLSLNIAFWQILEPGLFKE